MHTHAVNHLTLATAVADLPTYTDSETPVGTEMDKPPIPYDEQSRLAALKSLGILDTPAEERFDRFTRLAQKLFNAPIAAISLVDDKRQWFKSMQGLEVEETERDIAFCAHAITDDEIFTVDDASTDPRFADNPLVTGDPNIRFYAG